MFDNVVLETVIGLVFIYLLYSLLTTIVGEFVAAKLGLRQRLLRFSIERMLNDGYYKKRPKRAPKKKWYHVTWYAIVDAWRWLVAQFKGMVLYEENSFATSFAGKFYASPAIKYLSKADKKTSGLFPQTKPSYISADIFSTTLISLFKEKSSGETDDDKVDFCLTFNTYNLQPDTLKHFASMWETAKQTVPAFKKELMKWFDEMQDRNNGWHKQRMQLVSLLLGFFVAAAFNVDTIKIVKLLANDKEARGQLVEMSIAFAKDSTRYHSFTSGETDSLVAQHIDSSFALIRNDIRAANSILALGWPYSSYREKETVVCNKEDKQYKKLVTVRDEFVNADAARASLLRRLSASRRRLRAANDTLQQRYRDTLINYYSQLIRPGNAVLLAQQSELTDAIDSLKREMESAKKQLRPDSLSQASVTQRMAALTDSVNSFANTDFTSINRMTLVADGIEIHGDVPLSWWNRLWYWASDVRRNFFGLFITAIAVSFGAPFWFDMLKKIITLRSAGVKPEEKKAPPTPAGALAKDEVPPPPPPRTSAPPKGRDMAEDAILRYGAEIRSISGVKSVSTFMETLASGAKERNVMVSVFDNQTMQTVAGKYVQLISALTGKAPKLVITGQPRTQQGEGRIHVAAGHGGEGSLGCVLQRQVDKSFHILSCWHVLNDLSTPGKSSTKIMDHKNDKLGVLWAGNIRDQFDYGLAQCSTSASIKNNAILETALGVTKGKLKWRAVSQDDIDNMIDIHFVDFLDPQQPQKKSGVIFTDSASVDIAYDDKVRPIKDVLLITKTASRLKSITTSGNSGAVIFDNNNFALGMIIGGDSTFTYAVKISHVMSLHKEMNIA